MPKCVNSSGSHSAAYRQCPKNLETKETLKVVVRVAEKLPLNEAIQKLRQDKTAKKEGKTNSTPSESTRQLEIEPIQEWPEEENMKFADFIQRMETSPLKIKVLDNYKQPEVQSEASLESSVINFIQGLAGVIKGRTKKRNEGGGDPESRKRSFHQQRGMI